MSARAWSRPLGRGRLVAGGPDGFPLIQHLRDAANTKEAWTSTQEILRQCVADVEANGQCPALLGGDFNAELEALPYATELALAGWADLGEGPTCAIGAAARPSRIDLLLAIRELLARAGRVSTDWSMSLASHATQTFVADAERASMTLQCRPAKAQGQEPIATREAAWVDAVTAHPSPGPEAMKSQVTCADRRGGGEGGRTRRGEERGGFGHVPVA